MPIRVYVRKKPDRADLQLYYLDPATAREVSRTSGTRDKREAERAAAIWQQQLLEHRGPNDDGWKFFRDRFRGEHLSRVSRKTQSCYRSALNHYARLMNPSRLADVTASAASVFASKLLEEGSAQASIATYLTCLKAALNWAESVGIIGKAPRIKLPRQTGRLFMRGRPITEAEYGSMLEATKIWGREAAAYRRLLELLWLSGLRLSEALRLSWGSPPIYLDLEAQPYPQIIFYAEGHKGRRDDAMPMPPDLAAWLRKTPPRSRIGPVAPIAYRAESHVSAKISAIGESARIRVNDDGKAASAHDFRRAFGLRWAQKLMPIHLKTLMRHKEIKTTLKFYVGQNSADLGRIMWGEVVPKNVPKNGSKRRRAG